MLGVEGYGSTLNLSWRPPNMNNFSAHQLGNSIAVLRQYYNLGVRYMTLTHFCHNAFADSCGSFVQPEPLHSGLRSVFIWKAWCVYTDIFYSNFGISLIREMNRLGMLIDLSHTSDATALQALNHSIAPMIWSHSSARAVFNVSRNLPDEILKMIGTGEGQRDAVVMVSFMFHPLLLFPVLFSLQGQLRSCLCSFGWQGKYQSSGWSYRTYSKYSGKAAVSQIHQSTDLMLN